MTQDQTQEKKMSIDNETPEAWNALKKTRLDFHGNKIISGDVPFEWGGDSEDNNVKETSKDSKFQVQWHDDEDVLNEHPVFGETFDVHPASVREDMVNSPSHYTQGSIECIDAMQAMLSEEEFIGFLRGNSFKYRWRMRDKRQAVQDLRKAQWYEKRLKDIFEKMSTPNAV